MSKVEIFGFAASTYVRTALMACAEKRVNHGVSPHRFGEDSHRALHPFLKMPAMRHGKIVLFETAAIATYVDGIGAGPALQPGDVWERAVMWQWISTANAYLYEALVRAALCEDGPSHSARAARDRALDLLDAAPDGHTFLVGDALTLADLFVVPMVAFDRAAHAAGPDDACTTRPRLATWYDRMSRRDSFKDTAG